MAEPSNTAALVARGSKSGRWHLDLEAPSEFTRLFGEDALIAFARCFVGIDRVVSLRNLYVLNAKHGGTDGSYAKERNTGLLMVLLVGTMHELGKALARLKDVVGKSVGPSASNWAKLMEIRRRWHDRRIGKAIRDDMAHHLGKAGVFKAGLAAATGQPSARLYSADGPAMKDGAFEAPWDWVMFGLGLGSPEDSELVNHLAKDVADVPEVLLSLFQEVVSMRGIPIEDRRAD